MENNKIQNQQLQAKKYIEEHDLEKIISEMLNSVVYEKSKQPIIYMVGILSNLDQIPCRTPFRRRKAKLEFNNPRPLSQRQARYPVP
jgi:hypothetical protein